MGGTYYGGYLLWRVLIMGGTYYDAPHYATFLDVPSIPSSQVPISFPQLLLLRHF